MIGVTDEECILPVILLPAQVWDELRGASGERRLAAAVLFEQIFCLKGHATGVSHKQRPKEQRNAIKWFCSDDTSWPFSFLRICEYMRLDAQQTRSMLFQSVDQKIAYKPRHWPSGIRPHPTVRSIRRRLRADV